MSERSIVTGALQCLAAKRPVFHSEADFQHALAWQIQLDHPDARIRLETRPLPGRPVYLDMAVAVNGRRIAVELKYLVKAVLADIDGEHFELRPQSAQDVRRYDVIKDVCRLEEIVACGAADAGVMVALTNDPSYWSPGRVGTVDAAFRLHEGQVLSGELGWAAHAGAGTTDKRTAMLAVAGTYPLAWCDYSDLGGRAGRFRSLIIEIGVLPDTVSEPVAERRLRPTESSDPVAAPSPTGHSGEVAVYDKTCRDEILEAFAALERRHGRDTFSPAELVAEVGARGGEHPESTIRTHIVSAMCVNAPPNHAVRYPDLERVAYGLYRRIKK